MWRTRCRPRCSPSAPRPSFCPLGLTPVPCLPPACGHARPPSSSGSAPLDGLVQHSDRMAVLSAQKWGVCVSTCVCTHTDMCIHMCTYTCTHASSCMRVHTRVCVFQTIGKFVQHYLAHFCHLQNGDNDSLSWGRRVKGFMTGRGLDTAARGVGGEPSDLPQAHGPTSVRGSAERGYEATRCVVCFSVRRHVGALHVTAPTHTCHSPPTPARGSVSPQSRSRRCNVDLNCAP